LSSAKFAAARSNGDVLLYDEKYGTVHKFEAKDLQTQQSKIIGLCNVRDKIIVCTQQGHIVMCSLKDLDVSFSKIPNAEDLEVFKPDLKNSFIFAYGGKEQDLKIVNIEPETGEATLVFEAKNVKNDRLDMRQAIWITDLEFLPTKAENNFKLVTATRYGQLRVYETAQKQRPIINIKISDRPLCRVLRVTNDTVVATDNHISTFKYKIRSSDTQLVGKYGSGNTGAVQALYSKGCLLATGGLDRYLRVFDTESRELCGRIFVGNHITNVIVLEEDNGDLTAHESEEDVWKDLEKAGKRKKRRKLD
jgi:ribosome biogenesis protein NSA1